MRLFAVDLHVHTALSPCAADDMTPPRIVQAALEHGLAMIAICDHNAAGNVPSCVAAAASLGRAATRVRKDRRRRENRQAQPAGDATAGFEGDANGAGQAGVEATPEVPSQRRRRPAAPHTLTVLAGMEIATAEEVHVVGIFPNPAAASAAGAEVRRTLPDATVAYHKKFGQQDLLDASGNILDSELKMLGMAAGFDLAATIDLIHRHGGLAIAAHVNRPMYSVMSQLGVFPADAGFDAIEVFCPHSDGLEPAAPDESVLREFAGYGLPIVTSSDAHYLGDIGRCRTVVRVREPSFEELALALRGAGGRRVAGV
jgi:hypothetical protein